MSSNLGILAVGGAEDPNMPMQVAGFEEKAGTLWKVWNVWTARRVKWTFACRRPMVSVVKGYGRGLWRRVHEQGLRDFVVD